MQVPIGWLQVSLLFTADACAWSAMEHAFRHEQFFINRLEVRLGDRARRSSKTIDGGALRDTNPEQIPSYDRESRRWMDICISLLEQPYKIG